MLFVVFTLTSYVVVVSEINELRFGRNSPRLLDSELEIDGHVAFTLVHGPDNLFVDLVADSEEEATVWVACLSFLSKLKATSKSLLVCIFSAN